MSVPLIDARARADAARAIALIGALAMLSGFLAGKLLHWI